jgi:hypothetical protein
MNSSAKIGLVATATLIVAIAALGACFLSAGVGHGSYLPFAILFPYSFLTSVALGGGIDAGSGALALVQFPFYGVTLGYAWFRGGLGRRTSWILATHLLAAAASAVSFFRS